MFLGVSACDDQKWSSTADGFWAPLPSQEEIGSTSRLLGSHSQRRIALVPDHSRSVGEVQVLE